ncbi:hypothetical protein GGI43DRAFT_107489 [Trichoderma evansii]
MASPHLPPGTDLCKIPAAIPPPGVVPKLGGPAPLAPAIVAVSVVMLTFSTIFIVGRVWINFRKLKTADYFAIIGYVLSVAYIGLIFSILRYAGHIWDAPACWFTGNYMKILFAQGMLVGPIAFFAKSAILLLYLQIFIAHTDMRIAVYAGIVFTGLVYWVTIPLEIAINAPHPGDTWADLLVNGQVQKLLPWGVVQGSLAVVIDLYIFILPQPVLWRLNMSLKKRVAVCAVFFTALMGVIASIIGLVYRAALLSTTDIIYTQNKCFICVIVENSIALIVGSVPAWKAIWKKHIVTSNLYKTLTSKLHGNGSGHSDGTHLSKPFGFNMPAPKGQAPKHDGSEKSLQRFVSHRENTSHDFGSYYPPPTVQIQGGIRDGHGKPDSEDVSAGGIVRNFDITQEVHPDEQV